MTIFWAFPVAGKITPCSPTTRALPSPSWSRIEAAGALARFGVPRTYGS
jgi:hypothetical protein